MGSSGQTTQQSQNQQTQPWAPTIPALNNLINTISGTSTSVTPGQQTAVNSMTTAAGEIPNEGPAAAGAINKLFTSQNGIPQAGILGDAYQNYQRTLSPYLNPNYLDPYNTPGFKDALSKMNMDLTNQVKDIYAESGRDPTGAGSFGKTFANFLAPAEGSLIEGQFNQNVGTQIGAAGGAFGAGNTTATGETNLGQVPYMNELAAINASNNLSPLWMAPSAAQVAAANAGYSLPYTNIASNEGLMLPISGLGGQSSMTGTSTTTQSANPFSTALGAGLGLLSLMPSDKRLKENIEPVGLLHNGLNIYRYNYKGDTRPQIGVMAQEVEQVKPEAVVDVPVGGLWGSVKMVDYEKATQPLEEAA